MKRQSVLSKKIRIGVVSAGVIIGMVSLAASHVSFLHLMSPLSSQKEDVLAQLLPRLTQKQNTYHLSTQHSLISQASAETLGDTAKAYAVLDFDSGQIIDSKNGEKEVPIASLTKIMAAVVALDISSPGEKFAVTKKAADQIPTKIGVRVGERFTLQELLEAGLMTSANDAIEVIRDGIDAKYNDEVFVKAMNAKAEFLGLTHTHFTNPQGFDSSTHYSSTSDLAVLTHYALTNYPLIADIVKKDYVLLPATKEHKQYDLYNWNGLLDVYPNISGVKIGNTENAGTTTIVKSERNGTNLLVVVLGTPGVLERDLAAAELLDEGFESTLGLTPINITEKELRAKYATWKYWN